MDLTVIVATYGSADWARQGTATAAAVTEAPTVCVHADSLHEARNTGAEVAGTEWLVFLDADDELEPGYLQAMGAATADLRAPAVRYVRNQTVAQPRIPSVAGHEHYCNADCLAYGNWLVIGTAVRRDLFQQVGGFRDFSMYEDWDLWVRCWQAGATIEAAPRAVYRANVREDSRNRAPDHAQRLAAHRAIAEANGLPVP